MIVLQTQSEWRSTAAHATYVWPTPARDELVAFLWSRPEPSLRILASVIERPVDRSEAQ